MYPRLHRVEREHHWYTDIWHDDRFWALFALVVLTCLLVLVAFFGGGDSSGVMPFGPAYYP